MIEAATAAVTVEGSTMTGSSVSTITHHTIAATNLEVPIISMAPNGRTQTAGEHTEAQEDTAKAAEDATTIGVRMTTTDIEQENNVVNVVVVPASQGEGNLRPETDNDLPRRMEDIDGGSSGMMGARYSDGESSEGMPLFNLDDGTLEPPSPPGPPSAEMGNDAGGCFGYGSGSGYGGGGGSRTRGGRKKREKRTMTSLYVRSG